MTDKCAYCGHPKHPDVPPALISQERAAELWAARGPQHKLSPTPGECQMIRLVWNRLPPHATYAAAFARIQHHGSAALMAEPYRKGDRVPWLGRTARVAYARMEPPDYARASVYSIVLDDQRTRIDYTGTIVPAGELTPLPEETP